MSTPTYRVGQAAKILQTSSYHLKGDPAALSGLVWDSHPDYLITSKDLVQMPGRGFVPKVLFFY